MGGSDQNHPKEKEMEEGKVDTLQIAEERREVKSKGERERYTHLNAGSREQQGEIRGLLQ